MNKKQLSIPEKIDLIMDQVGAIGKLFEEDAKVKTYAQTLDLKKTIKFLSHKGYVLSESSLYKMTSGGGIPHGRFGGKLVFDRDELLQWCRNKTVKGNLKSNVIKNLAATANKKLKNGK